MNMTHKETIIEYRYCRQKTAFFKADFEIFFLVSRFSY